MNQENTQEQYNSQLTDQENTLSNITVDSAESVVNSDNPENITAEDTPIVNSEDDISADSSYEAARQQFIDNSPSPDIANDEYKWYCIRTYTGHEDKAVKTILAEVKRLGYEPFIRDVVIPQETVFEVRNGKKRTKVRNFLPGYVLCKAFINEDKDNKNRDSKNKVLDLLTNTTSVVALVGRKNDPTPLQQFEIDRIFARTIERADVATIDKTYRKGDPIKVIDGPFNGFNGMVLEVSNEKHKVKVEINILGRKTPVELNFEQIQFDKPE